MTATTPNADIQQLTQTVATLAEALARSERRHAHLARTLRWGTLALVTLVAGAIALVGDRLGVAYAKAGDPGQATTVVEALNNIHQDLMMFGMLGQGIGEGLTQTMLSDEKLQARVNAYITAHGLQPTPENVQAYAAPAALYGAVVAGVEALRSDDLGIILRRLRADSDQWHDLIVNPSPTLNGIKQELALMNVAMQAVPAMAVQMDFMNRNMGSMSHSMGSTMGRMGSWLP